MMLNASLKEGTLPPQSLITFFNLARSISLTIPRTKVNKKKISWHWRIFNKREFEEESSQIDWSMVTSQETGTDHSFSLFYHKILKLLDEMAPMQKLTKNCPWITHGILISMCTRDSIYKKFVKETDPVLKDNYHKLYKTHRNRIITLIRFSKKQYYAKYFEEKHCKVKKHGMAI